MARRRDILDEIEAAASGDPRQLLHGLRRCLTLGGLTGSSKLREWASDELKGYDDDDRLPRYRLAPSLLMGDSSVARSHVVPLFLIPGDVREMVDDEPRLRSPLGEIIEQYDARQRAGDDHVKIAPVGMTSLMALINNELVKNGGHPGQHYERIYYVVPLATFGRVIDVVRTTLVELVAEMRAARPGPDLLPTGDAADAAANIAVRGVGNRVTYVQATNGSSVSSMLPTSSSRWSATFWVALTALATVGLVIVAVVQLRS